MLKRVVTGAVIFVLMCVGIVFQGWVLRLMLLSVMQATACGIVHRNSRNWRTARLIQLLRMLTMPVKTISWQSRK